MYALATCTGTVLRGTSVDEYGDTVDTDVVHTVGVLAAIREVKSTVYDTTTQTPRVVRVTSAQFPSDADVRTTDRFRDDTHGITYYVENVTAPGADGFTADLDVELRRVT